MNNDNISSISKFFKRGKEEYNEKIFYDKNFNPKNNEIQDDLINEDEFDSVKEEVKNMLRKVFEFKSKGFKNFSERKYTEAIDDYIIVILFFILFFRLWKQLKLHPKVKLF